MTDLHDFNESELREAVAEYLRLEYGESIDDLESLKVSDLIALGIKNVDGREMFCWEYPCSGPGEMWATAELNAQGQICLSMRSKPYDGPPRSGFEQLVLVIYDFSKTRTFSSKTFKIDFKATESIIRDIQDHHIKVSNDRVITVVSQYSISDSGEPLAMKISLAYCDRRCEYEVDRCSDLFVSTDIDDDLQIKMFFGPKHING